MATYTTNLNLKKPAGTDYVLVGDFNENSNTIDASVGKLSELTTAVKTSLVLAINEANDRGTHPPYIGENNHWYEWDSATTQYVDSGVVAEGVDGNDGISAYVHIKWSATQPTSDSDMKATPDAYIGIYSGTNSTAPTAYTSYSWYQYKGAKGDTGTAGTGNNWYSGNAITGTSTTPTAYATGITLAQVGDVYMNTGALPDTGRVYKCTLGGNASTALWKYDALLRGADGDGTGDMLKSVYDTNNDGVVNDSDKLGGVAASGYAKEISGLTAKATLADSDALTIADSEASNAQKKTLWSTIKSMLKTYFDTLYAPKIAVVSDLASTTKTLPTVWNNTEYQFGTLTALTITAFPAGNWFCRILCTAGSGMTLSLPAGTRKAGGAAFAYNAGDKIQLYLDQDGATLIAFR